MHRGKCVLRAKHDFETHHGLSQEYPRRRSMAEIEPLTDLSLKLGSLAL